MKTLLLLSAVLLALSSCHKCMPRPCPDPYSDAVYYADPDPDPDPDPAPDPNDPGDDDPGYDDPGSGDPGGCHAISHAVHH